MFGFGEILNCLEWKDIATDLEVLISSFPFAILNVLHFTIPNTILMSLEKV
jgi:hypothetical protein